VKTEAARFEYRALSARAYGPVALVADYGVPRVGELDAYLVLATGFELELEEAQLRAAGEDAPSGHRSLGTLLLSFDPVDLSPPVLFQPRVENSRYSVHRSLDEGHIEPARDQLVPAFHEESLRPAVGREDHDAGSVAVDAMDYRRPAFRVFSSDLLGGDIEEAARARPFGRNDGEADRLVESEYRIVLVDEAGRGLARRSRWRPRARLRGRGACRKAFALLPIGPRRAGPRRVAFGARMARSSGRDARYALFL